MLLPLTILIRESASEPPIECVIGLNLEEIARVEEGMDEGTIHVYADGSRAPYTIAGTVEEFVSLVNACLFGEEEGPECEPAPIEAE
ncbi:MAG: hypothetical protein WC390_11285 [Sulfurimonas sp.]|jgi:hypothetical protein